MSEKSGLHREYVLELENELRELEEREQSSTRRLQMLLYPSLLAFIILAAYGFYLVQSLTSNVAKMSNSMTTISNSIEKDMEIISSNIIVMSENMTSLVGSTGSMAGQMGQLVDSTVAMKNDVGSMSNSINNMTKSTRYMQQDMKSLNHNISTPLSMFNKFLPWSNSSVGRYPGSPPQNFMPPSRQQANYYNPPAPAMPQRVKK
ncbi:MAG: hypothetical protein KAH22_02655 [Thiotrichaceae bacterium]|nr:hypothetical protein [Thiotrichaceae bacterium]